MNIQYENDEQQYLVGSFKAAYHILSPLACLRPQPSTGEAKTHESSSVGNKNHMQLTLGQPSPERVQEPEKRNGEQQKQIKYSRQEQQYRKIEEFVSYMAEGEKSSKSARYYLSESEWDLDKAVREYQQDIEWEKKHVEEGKRFSHR